MKLLLQVILKPVLSSILNVTTKVSLLESVKINLSLISIMKSNLSLSQKDKLSTCTTCHVSMDKMLNSPIMFLVSELLNSLSLKFTESDY